MTKEQIKIEVDHIFESGANEVRVMGLIDRLRKEAAKEIRHAAAEIVASIGEHGGRDISEAHRDIMNLQITDK